MCVKKHLFWHLVIVCGLGACFNTALIAQSPNCVGSQVICNSGNVPYLPAGPGTPDLSSNTWAGCGISETQPAWYYFEFTDLMPPGSILEFTLTPSLISDNYDFSIWGPSTSASPLTCDSLGAAIRCNSAPPTGNGSTGLVTGGSGNSFEESLTVNPGEGYYLLVDNSNSSSPGFTFSWVGSAATYLDCGAMPPCNLEAIAESDTVICSEATITLSGSVTGAAGGGGNYAWSSAPPEGILMLNNPWTQNPMLTGNGLSGTYIYTLTASFGGCVATDQITITLLPEADPVFTLDICENDPPTVLPTISDDGIAGTWVPAVIDPSGLGGTTVTAAFKPDPGQMVCTNALVVQISITAAEDPLFSLPQLCELDPEYVLPLTSDNGISGNWTPATIDPGPMAGQFVTATFTPAVGECANVVQMDIYIEESIMPLIAPVGPLCALDDPVGLPSTSTDGYTGTWDIPVIDPGDYAGTSVTVIFTPDGGQGCVAPTALNIAVNAADEPLFDAVELCAVDDPFVLPTTSSNGFSGSWSIPVIDPAGQGGTTVASVFTPTVGPGDCILEVTLNIPISTAVDPAFSLPSDMCDSEAPVILPNTSDNGIAGTWDPPVIDPAGQGGSTLTAIFTSTDGQCAEDLNISIAVYPAVVPQFDPQGPLCALDAPVVLPTTSNNGVSGIWDVPVVDPAGQGGMTITVHFTPNGGQGPCVEGQMLTIDIDAEVTPQFAPVGPLCALDNPVILPAASVEDYTGTWSIPVIDPGDYAGTSVTVIFTPDGGQGCVAPAALNIDVNAADEPLFDAVELCAADDPFVLPTTSTNGFNGSWSIPVIDPTGQGGTTVVSVFTPTVGPGDCILEVTLNIPISTAVDPAFSLPFDMCDSEAPVILPNTSDNGIAGTWVPPVIDPAGQGGSTLTAIFTPTDGQCAEDLNISIAVYPAVVPQFDPQDPLCALDAPVVLPTTSNNGVSGTWDVPVVDPAGQGGMTITVHFSPNGGQGPCVEGQMLTIDIDAEVTPQFAPVGPLCALDNPVILPATSVEGYTGTWSIPVIDPAGQGGTSVTSEFTPDPGQGCLTTQTVTVLIETPDVPSFEPVELCALEAPLTLPGISTNGYTGTWSPATIDPNGQGGTSVTATFTPDPGPAICVEGTTINIPVQASAVPTFNLPSELCDSDGPLTLPNTSGNGLTGSWNPSVLNPSGQGGITLAATFTPSGTQCAEVVAISIVVEETIMPQFNPIDTLCSLDDPFVLPTVSMNGISGTWDTPVINPADLGGTTIDVIFTPEQGQVLCMESTSLSITVLHESTPQFDPMGPLCVLDEPLILPAISTENIAGFWIPPVIDPQGMGGTTMSAVFTPDPGQGCYGATSLDIAVTSSEIPSFAQVQLCALDDPFTLPPVSVNGFSGAWDPAVIDPTGQGGNTISATFTPSTGPGACIETVTLAIPVEASEVPEFSLPPGLCANNDPLTLPVLSNNGITGSWNPMTLDPGGSEGGTVTATFTPEAGQCAETVVINMPVQPDIIPEFDAIGPLCALDAPITLPMTSLDGINGVWDVPVVDPSQFPGTSNTVTFTPAAGQGECLQTASMTIHAVEAETPVFSPVGPLCTTDAPLSLPPTSLNGVQGQWSMPVIDPQGMGNAVVASTFKPDTAYCAFTAEIAVEIVETPVIEEVTIQQPTDCAIANGSIHVFAQGINLEYSIDGGASWQTSLDFFDLGSGVYQVRVRQQGHSICYAEDGAVLSAAESPILSEVISNGPSDCATSDGSIEIFAEGEDLEYSIDGGLTWHAQAIFNGLPGGIYQITIRPAATTGCQITTTVILEAPEPPVIHTLIEEDPSDCGLEDGTITVHASNGLIEFSLDNGLTWQPDPVFTGLGSGIYQVIARLTDAMLCSDTASVGLAAPSSPIVDSLQTQDVSDCHADNGRITVIVEGSGYAFSIDSGATWQASPVFTGLAAGAYTVLVRNINAAMCVTSIATIIEAPDIPEILALAPQNPMSCVHDDGSVSVTVSGDDPEFSVDNGGTWQSSPIFPGLAAGTYTLLVRPAGNPMCTIAQTFTLEAPVPAAIQNLTATHPSDCGLSDGTITVSATGQDLQFSIDNGGSWQVQNVFAGLPAGNYTIIARSITSPSCSTAQSVAIAAPLAPVVNGYHVANPSDCGVTDGQATVSATGEDLEFSINGGMSWQADNTFTDLGPGTYTIIIRPAKAPDCAAFLEVTFQSLSPPVVQLLAWDVTACEANDGRVRVISEDTSVEYSLDLVIWQQESEFNGLSPGMYTVFSRIAGTTQCLSTNTVTIGSPQAPVIDDVAVRPLSNCDQHDGTAEVIVTHTTPVEFALDLAGPWQSVHRFENLGAGAYKVWVRNVNSPSCIDTAHFTLVNPPCVCASVAVSAVAQPVTCFDASDGAAEIIQVQGTNEFTVYWDTGEEGLSVGNLEAGWVSYLIAYDADCTLRDSLFISSPEPLLFEVESTEADCPDAANGSLTITLADGGTGEKEFSIDGMTYQTSPVFAELARGSYTVHLRDENMCHSYTVVQVDAGPAPQAILPEIITVAIGDSIILTPQIASVDSFWWAPASEVLNPGELNALVSPDQNTTFTLTVTRGLCMAQASVLVEVNTDIHIYIPNVFSPNGDGINDVFTVFGDDAVIDQIDRFSIFARWGDLVFDAGDFAPGDPAGNWDGTTEGIHLNPGVFVYTVSATLHNGNQVEQHGTVTLVR